MSANFCSSSVSGLFVFGTPVVGLLVCVLRSAKSVEGSGSVDVAMSTSAAELYEFTRIKGRTYEKVKLYSVPFLTV